MRALIYLTVFFSIVLSNKIDINNTKNLDDLPLVENKIKAIERYISQNNGIKTIYDLLEIEEISSKDIDLLKSLIVVREPELSEFVKNQKMSSYKLEYWFASDGNQESLSDMWLDRFDPKNINQMSYDEIYSLPNVSPIDAVGVMKQKEGRNQGDISIKKFTRFKSLWL